MVIISIVVVDISMKLSENLFLFDRVLPIFIYTILKIREKSIVRSRLITNEEISTCTLLFARKF
jgi:hypothetical protein